MALRLGDQKAAVTNRRRLAIAYQYSDKHDLAELIFRQLLQDLYANHQLYDYLLQHYAKHLVELGDTINAEYLFLKAMKVRIEKNDPTLIASTQDALNALRSLRSTTSRKH